MSNIKRYYSIYQNEDKTADIYIYGDIVDAVSTGIDEAFGVRVGETSGLSIVTDLQNVNADVINVHINSAGGYTSEGLAIYNALKNSKAKIKTYCDGFACSAASIVFMAGEERIMNSASALMIHNAWTEVQGNGAQLRQQAEILDKISQAAGNAYAENVNISREELDQMLDGKNHEGTWVLADEAVEKGFATAIENATKSKVANQLAMTQILQKIKQPTKMEDKTLTNFERIKNSMKRKKAYNGN